MVLVRDKKNSVSIIIKYSILSRALFRKGKYYSSILCHSGDKIPIFDKITAFINFESLQNIW